MGLQPHMEHVWRCLQESFRQLYREGGLENNNVTIEVPPNSGGLGGSMSSDGPMGGAVSKTWYTFVNVQYCTCNLDDYIVDYIVEVLRNSGDLGGSMRSDGSWSSNHVIAAARCCECGTPPSIWRRC